MRPTLCESTPKPVVVLDCGSRSTTRHLASSFREARREIDGGSGLACTASLVGDSEDSWYAARRLWDCLTTMKAIVCLGGKLGVAMGTGNRGGSSG